MIIFIQEIIISQNVIYIQRAESHSWYQLWALKIRLTSTNDARSLNIETRYHKLCKELDSRDIKTWLNDWQLTYTEIKSYKIAEMTERRSIRNFLMILTKTNVKTHLMTFANNHLMNLTDGTDMYVLIVSGPWHITWLDITRHEDNGGNVATTNKSREERIIRISEMIDES
jgi:hypothetical protein